MKNLLFRLILILFSCVFSAHLYAADNPASHSPSGTTKHIWFGQDKMLAQMSEMQHKMHGTTESPKAPMGKMEMPGQKEPKHHDHMEHHKQLDVSDKMRPRSTLKPAEGAKVKILSPKAGAEVKGDEVKLHFELVRGKRGHHIHAYVDGTLMGMFTPNGNSQGGEGILTGLSPGRHTLEIRAVNEDHSTELDATDTIHFVVK